MSDDDWKVVTIQLPPEDYERYDRLSNTKSGTGRLILRTWMDAVEDYDIKEDAEAVQIAVLNAYKNAIEKNIQVMKSQQDKMDSAIEDIADEEEDDVEVLEIDLHLKGRKL